MNILRPIKIPNDYKDRYKEIQIQNTSKNFWVLSLLILLSQVVILTFNIIHPFTRPSDILTYYYRFYGASIMVNLIFIVIQHKVNGTSSTRSKELLLLTLKFYFVFYAMGVAIIDQFQGGEIVTYYTLLFVLSLTYELILSHFIMSILSIHLLLLYLLNMLYTRGFITTQVSDSSTQIVIFVLFIHYYVSNHKRREFVLNQDLLTLNRELELKNKYDSLSQIYNRGYWEKKYTHLFEEAVAQKKTLGLSIIDIDYFKEYNDYYGHIEGDEVIRIVGAILKETAKSYGGYVGRFGGDEFIAVFDETYASNLYTFANTVKEAIDAKKINHEKSKTSDHLTLSIGCHSGKPTDHSELWSFVAQADKKLYDIKRNRNQSN